jgi:3'-5' exoribonuclease
MSEAGENHTEDDLLTLAELRQVARAQPQSYRVRAQIDSRSERTTSQGSLFLELRLADGTETLPWRLFDNSPLWSQAPQLTRGQWIELSAQWLDTGKYGIEPRAPSYRILSEEEIATLLCGPESTREQQQADWAEIQHQIDALADPRLRQLCLLFLQRYGERFRRTAAARENHHARRGGLVEHVAQMMRAAAALSTAYPHINRDLLLAGVLFHDCGKLWENTYAENSFTMPYQLHGEMLGHISLGLELVNKLWRDLMDTAEAQSWTQLEPASDLVRLHLLHLIGSHHGEYEYGAPVLPKTPEAVLLHHIDNIDAKLEMLRRGYETSKSLAPGIFEKFRPWRVNIISPLPPVPQASGQPPGESPPEEV